MADSPAAGGAAGAASSGAWRSAAWTWQSRRGARRPGGRSLLAAPSPPAAGPSTQSLETNGRYLCGVFFDAVYTAVDVMQTAKGAYLEIISSSKH
jgi:hypothetical protein